MAFERETGIKESHWSGKYWARWSDAVAEAGFEANQMNPAYDREYLVENLVAMIQDLGKWPTNPERKLYHARNPETPSRNTYYRLGNQQAQAKAVLEYASKNEVSDDVVALCRDVADKPRADDADALTPSGGFVYLVKSGRHYKIGHSNDPSRRTYEMRLLMPDPVTEVHRIASDDPAGVEAYWHRRFADRRAEGEWFKLESADVRAFKSRKSM